MNKIVKRILIIILVIAVLLAGLFFALYKYVYNKVDKVYVGTYQLVNDNGHYLTKIGDTKYSYRIVLPDNKETPVIVGSLGLMDNSKGSKEDIARAVKAFTDGDTKPTYKTIYTKNTVSVFKVRINTGESIIWQYSVIANVDKDKINTSSDIPENSDKIEDMLDYKYDIN